MKYEEGGLPAMWGTCPFCGTYASEPPICENAHGDQELWCSVCGRSRSFKPQPLFLITGASGVGKTSLSARLFYGQTNYLVMENDILWSAAFDTPEDDYRTLRETWLRLASNIGQGGKPVVLCGCATPQQYNNCINRRYISKMYYLALYCDDEVLENRLRIGRSVHDEGWIQSSLAFNRWIRDSADKTDPPMTRLDTTSLTIEQAAERAEQWIGANLRMRK